MIGKHLQFTATGLGMLAMLGASPSFASTCFTAFGGSIHYQFTQPPSAFTTPGTRSLNGITFGALSPCAGLARWPLVATVQVDPFSAALGFRAMTVDASGCGAVDYIVDLNPGTLSGPLQLHNDRNSFSNSDTLTFAACVPPPPVAAAAAVAGRADALGNAD